MHRSHLIYRTVQISACGLAFLMYASPAMSETSRSKAVPDTRACSTTHKSAQEREQSGHLIEANQLFLKCARESCGNPVSEQCRAGHQHLFFTLPSVVLSVADTQGEPLVDVEVMMDGHLLTSHLDGLSVPIDPGTHEFSFSANGGSGGNGGLFPSRKITIAEGERNRVILVSQSSEKKPAASDPVVALTHSRPVLGEKAPTVAIVPPPSAPALANAPAAALPRRPASEPNVPMPAAPPVAGTAAPAAAATSRPAAETKAPTVLASPPTAGNVPVAAVPVSAAPIRLPTPATKALPMLSSAAPSPTAATTPVAAAAPPSRPTPAHETPMVTPRADEASRTAPTASHRSAQARRGPQVRARQPASAERRGASPLPHSRPTGPTTPGSMAAALGL